MVMSAVALPEPKTTPCSGSQSARRHSTSDLRTRWVLESLYYCVIVLWIVILLPRSMADPDIWWHLRNAAEQWQNHGWLHQDLYSFSALHSSWINHEWLAEIPFALAWKMAGEKGIYLLNLCLLQGIFLGLFWLVRQNCRSLPIALGTTLLGSLLATVSFGPRTLLFGWVCLVVELIILDRSVQQPRVLLSLPLLFLVWVNLHGSWLIGLVVLAVWIVFGCFAYSRGSIVSTAWSQGKSKSSAWVLLCSIGALFINPYGWRLVAYPFDLAFRQKLNVSSVQEWQSLDTQSVRGELFLLMLAVVILSQMLCRLDWSLQQLSMAGIGILSAFLHARFLFLAAILVTPLLARQLDPVFGTRMPVNRFTFRCMLPFALLAIISALILSSRLHPATRVDGSYPHSALPMLTKFHPHGRILNDYLWGGYLEFHTPQIPVFIDSRVDIFERNGVLRDYLDMVRSKNSLALIDRYQIRYVLFESDAPLVYLLRQTQAWNATYDDGRVVLLERSTPLPGTDHVARAVAP